jgi:hypothetical protein
MNERPSSDDTDGGPFFIILAPGLQLPAPSSKERSPGIVLLGRDPGA